MAAHSIVLLLALLSPLATAAPPAFTLVCTLHDENSSREWTMEVDPAFFEWQVVPGQKKKQKIRIARADGDLVTLAGLYDYWHRGDEAIESYTILTTAPNAMMEPIHNRMPVILGADDEEAWLDAATSVETARAMCLPCPSDWLTVSPAS